MTMNAKRAVLEGLIMMMRARIAVLAAALFAITGAAAAQNCPDYNPDRNPYFGDTHVHTAFSFDAVLLGVEAEPGEAYAFAKGALMTLAPAGRTITQSAQEAQLDRPLDFTAVTDHAEFFGEFHVCTVPPADPSDPDAAYNTDFCEDYRASAFGNRDLLTTPGPEIGQRTFRRFTTPLRDEFPLRHEFCRDNPDCVASTNLIWQETQDQTQLANDPCTFSAMNAYEWSKIDPPATNNTGARVMHRNVIFKGDAVPASPISVFEEPEIELLWERLRQECRDAGTQPRNEGQAHHQRQTRGFG